MSDNSRGFSVFALDTPQAVRTFRMKLERMRADRLSELVVAQDWSDFKRRVGILEGLDEALHVCDDIEKAERA
jgi:hypothetical protein